MSTCKLTARWTPMRGPPMPGQFLKAPKGRTAYEIVAVRKIKQTADRNGNRYMLTCARWNPNDVPPGATVHTWHWDKR